MKSINARSTLLGFCLYILIGFLATEVQSGDYYIYRDPNGVLVISNKKPPPGSKIIKQQSLSDLAESENPQVQAGSTTQPKGNTPNSKPSNNK
jgi:Domain of unknown function (DUF4124)